MRERERKVGRRGKRMRRLEREEVGVKVRERRGKRRQRDGDEGMVENKCSLSARGIMENLS